MIGCSFPKNVAAAVFTDQTKPTYAAAIRPILQEHCFRCHGADEQKADFLYLIERGKSEKTLPLTDFERASRLSYFLWGTMPDEELFALAASGHLREEKVLERQVRAMISNPRSGEIGGIDDLKGYLKTQGRDRFAKALTKKVLAYSIGRSLELTDEAAIGELAARFAKSDYQLSELIVAIVQSSPFQPK